MSRVAASAFKCNFYYRFACQFSLKVVFYEPITCNNESHFKDGYRIKTPRNKTPVRTKIMNMNIKSRLCKRFDKERKKKRENFMKNSILFDRFVLYPDSLSLSFGFWKGGFVWIC